MIPVFMFSCFLFYFGIVPSCVASCFSVPLSNVYPSLSLSCLSPASLHLYLIPSLVRVYIVFVLPLWCHSVSPPMSPQMSPSWCLSDFCSMSFHWFILCFCCYFVFCCCDSFLFFLELLLIVSFKFVLRKLAFCSPILPPICCRHLGPHLVCQFITTLESNTSAL